MRPWTLLLLAALVILPALGTTALWSRDETTYAEIARWMARGGDWLTPRLDGEPWFVHPPLCFWLMAASMGLIPVVEVAARLPSALFGIATVMAVYACGRSMFGPRAGWLAGAAMLVNLHFWLESRMALLDTTFLFFMVLSLLGFWHGFQGRRWWGWWLAFVSAGLACLTKGPFGLLYPFAVVVVFGWGRLRAVPWFSGLALTLPIGLAWYVIETIRYGRAFTDSAVVYYFFGRLGTTVENQAGPAWLYLPIFFLGFFPWSVFLPGAIIDLWRRRTESAPRFVLTWLILPFLVMTLASTKLPSYALLIFPPAALTVGSWLATRDARHPSLVAAAVAVAIAAAAFTYHDARVEAFAGAVQSFGALWIALAAVGVMAAWRGRAGPLWTAGMASLLVVTGLLLTPQVEAARAIKPMGILAEKLAGPDDCVATLGTGLYGIAFYANRDVLRLAAVGQAESVLRAPRRAYVVVDLGTYEEMRRRNAATFEVVGRQANVMMVTNRH